MSMYDLSSKFASFYNDSVVLSQAKQTNLHSKKDLNIQRLKDGLKEYNEENNTSYSIAETCVQGSVAMSTVVQNEDGDYDEDKIMEDVMEAGADDFSMEEGSVEITCEPSAFGGVLEALQGMGYTFETAEVQMVPNNYVNLSDPDQIKMMGLLLEKMEENDDVQNVWHNWENEDAYEG